MAVHITGLNYSFRFLHTQITRTLYAVNGTTGGDGNEWLSHFTLPFFSTVKIYLFKQTLFCSCYQKLVDWRSYSRFSRHTLPHSTCQAEDGSQHKIICWLLFEEIESAVKRGKHEDLLTFTAFFYFPHLFQLPVIPKYLLNTSARSSSVHRNGNEQNGPLWWKWWKHGNNDKIL